MTVIDCPDPCCLARFYCQVLGMRVDEDIDGRVVICSGPGLRQLAFSRSPSGFRRVGLTWRILSSRIPAFA